MDYECAKILVLSCAEYNIIIGSRSRDNKHKATTKSSMLPYV